MRNLSLPLLGSVVVAVGSASAHDGMHGPGGEYDADQDGELSLLEYTDYLKTTKQDVSKAAALFAMLDTNKSGSLSDAEFIIGLQKQKTENN